MRQFCTIQSREMQLCKHAQDLTCKLGVQIDYDSHGDDFKCAKYTPKHDTDDYVPMWVVRTINMLDNEVVEWLKFGVTCLIIIPLSLTAWHDGQ